jgi:transposase
MRKSFDGLSGIVQHELKKDPLSTVVFIFLNRRHNQGKLLLWEGDGFSLYHKRLEKGTYEMPSGADGQTAIYM